MKTAWYKTRWGVGALAGVAGVSLGSGVAGSGGEQAAVPATVTTVSVTPPPVVKTVMATVTATALETTTATAVVTVTETAQPAPVAIMEEEPKANSGDGNANRQGSVYYSSCKEAKKAGVAPLHVGDPGYRAGLDRDDDGVACE